MTPREALRDCLATFDVIERHYSDQALPVNAIQESREKIESALSNGDEDVGVLKETIKRLNRRTQAAEAAAQENLEACRRKGVPLGRALANYSATKAEQELTSLADISAQAIGTLLANRNLFEKMPADVRQWAEKQVKTPGYAPIRCAIHEIEKAQGGGA